MKISKKFGVQIAILAIFSMSGCGKSEPEVSPQQKAKNAETLRQLSAGVNDLAKALAATNPRHDRQYYEDRVTQIITDCVKKVDEDAAAACVKTKVEALKNE